ncbi:MAG: pirin-like C-terminal cupin domain-containing protein [Gallionella sp.]
MDRPVKTVGEPIIQHGPFLMNTKEAIPQAARDFQEGGLDQQGKQAASC